MPRVTVLLLALLALSFAPTAPATGDPLEADAGFSAAAYNGEALPVSGTASGGIAPYAFSWSLAGSASPFADASAASTTLDTALLAEGAHTIDLLVTDATGARASDTVRIVVDEAPILLSRSVPVRAGAPEEMVLPNGGSADRVFVNFAVPSGMARLEATLSWPDALSDLDLDLTGPLATTSGAQGRTAANPERVTLALPRAGLWQAQVKPIASAGTTAELVVQAFPAGALPLAVAQPARPYGTLDAQRLRADAQGGAAPYAFTWDLDGDGWHETPGQEATAARGPGAHLVSFKVTDAAGFEVQGLAPLDVRDAERALRFGCGEDPATSLRAMEFEQSGGTCWVHGGHHTYALPAASVLKGVQGFAFAVEQQFAPSVPQGDAWALHVEASLDGRAWSEVGTGRYDLRSQRQQVLLDLETETPASFVRIRAPLSATQGLSGYLDHSEGYLFVDGLPAMPVPLAPATRALTCEADLMEDVFATHPCWFGGLDRYDAPSFWHTYALGGESTLARVSGSFTLLPWRLDDWNQGNATSNASLVRARVLTSVDGVAWTERATVATTFGTPTPFDVALDDAPARFVRLFPEEHARFDQTAQFAPNHHPRGYFVDSRLVVAGLLPS